MEHLKKIKAKDLGKPNTIIELSSITIVLDIYDELKDVGHTYPAFAHRYNEIVDKINDLINYRNKHDTIREGN